MTLTIYSKNPEQLKKLISMIFIDGNPITDYNHDELEIKFDSGYDTSWEILKDGGGT